MSETSALFTALFSSELALSLSRLSSQQPLETFSRVDSTRLTKALSCLSGVELVSAESFRLYESLYCVNFPHDGERERSDLIIERLEAEAAGMRAGLAPYHIIGLRGSKGEAVGAAHFSVLRLRRENTARGADSHSRSDGKGGPVAEAAVESMVVPYLQYIYISPDYRRRDLGELLHTLVLAVTTADAITIQSTAAAAADYNSSQADDVAERVEMEKTVVPFTLFETEPASYGEDEVARSISKQRSMVHARSGAVALMLRRRGEGDDDDDDDDDDPGHQKDDDDHDRKPTVRGQLLSPHCQPGLEDGRPPVSLVWAIRPSPCYRSVIDVTKIGSSLIHAYYQSLRDEKFPEKNIALAEKMVRERCARHEFITTPLEQVVLPPRT